MSSTPTPGPWTAHIERFSTSIQIGEAFISAPYQPPYGRGKCPQQDADARLIAAAPCLYAACKELIRIVDSDSVEPVELARCRFDDVRSALAKAEGGV